MIHLSNKTVMIIMKIKLLKFVRTLYTNRVRISLILVLCIGGPWVLSELMSKPSIETANANIDQKASPRISNLVAVRTQKSISKPFQSELLLQGRTAASRFVNLKAEISGKIVEVLAKEGDFVRAGTAILKIAVNDRAVRVEQAKASLNQRRLQVDAARKLAKESFGTQVRLAEAEAQFSQAKVNLLRFNIDLENTIIKAPFDGIFNSKTKDLGAFLNAGDIVGTIVDLSPIKIVVEVSEKDIGSLKTGMPGSIKLSDGSSYNGTVNYVASLSDNSTRTFRVELVVPNDSANILAGLAAQVNLPAEEIKAHQIPPSSLTLSDDGRIGVKIVSVLKTISFRPVKILNDGVSGTWVSGLEDEVDIVVVGQGYVNTGQLVTTVDVSEKGSKNTINTDANL
ncbi:MAG: hypothetical protein CMM25_03570 [Rhodospirillaceae bacterium]|nr:hypothetical protein [Rhodospirillaceae bacterium]